MNENTGEIRRLAPNEKPKVWEKLLSKAPDPRCRFGCAGKGHQGINPRTGKYHPCACTLAGYKDVK